MAIGNISRAAKLTGFSCKKMCKYGCFAGTKQSDRDKEVSVRQGSTIVFSFFPSLF